MRHTFISGVLVVATSVLGGAQTPTRYDRAAEKVFSGTIKAVVSFAAPDGNVGVHFDLKTADGIVSVHVAPAMFIGQQNFWFYADDRLEIVGTRITEDENAAVWAKAIHKGADLLVLRSDDGTPKWDPKLDGTDGCGVNHPPLQRATER
jgi:hypothetical protein